MIYYVRSDGNDANTGLDPSASTAWATILKAANTLVAGDIVYIAPGTYAGANTISNSGTADNWISFIGDKTSSKFVDIAAGDVIINGNLRANHGFIVNQNYIYFEGFKFLNCNSGISNTELQKSFIKIIDNSFEACNYAIDLFKCSSNITIEKNEIIGGVAGTLVGIRINDDTQVCTNLLIKDNFLSGITQEGIYLNILLQDSIIEHNTIYSDSTCIYVKSQGNVIVKRNTAAYNSIESFGNDIRFENNLIYGSMAYGIKVNSGNNVVLVNNTISLDSLVGKNIYSITNGIVTLFNNILCNTDGVCLEVEILNSANLFSNFNSFTAFAPNPKIVKLNGITYTSLAAWQAATLKDLNSIEPIDPEFIDETVREYHLRETSPCKDAGTNSFNGYLAPSNDIDGQNRPSNLLYDIGADEVMVFAFLDSLSCVVTGVTYNTATFLDSSTADLYITAIQTALNGIASLIFTTVITQSSISNTPALILQINAMTYANSKWQTNITLNNLKVAIESALNGISGHSHQAVTCLPMRKIYLS